MPATIDIMLVLVAVASAAAYLISRKIRSARQLTRDWTTGRVDACDHCPAITIRHAQNKKMTTK